MDEGNVRAPIEVVWAPDSAFLGINLSAGIE